ncbi:hypothetical protein D3C78_1336390 [compost metagenome]
MPCTASTRIALRIADSRMPSRDSRASGFCASRPGISSSGSTASGTSAITPPIDQSTTRNSRKNGRSASEPIVVEVISSRTCSISRSWAMKEPVDFDTASLRRRSAWPNTRSEMRRSARLPMRSDR